MAALRRVDASYWLAFGLSLVAVAGPALLIVRDFLTLFEVQSVTATISGGVVSGGRNHAYAMLIIGLLAAPMAYGAIRGGSRPAMVALGALGVVAALIALLKDLPVAAGTSTLDKSFAYASAHAVPGIGFYLETLGATLLLIAAAGGLLLRPAGKPRDDRQPPAGDDRDELRREQDAAARAAARTQR